MMLALPNDCIGEIISWTGHLTQLQLSYTCCDFGKYRPSKIPADVLLREVAATSSLSLYELYNSTKWRTVWRILIRDYAFLAQSIKITSSECLKWIISRFATNSSSKAWIVIMQFAISWRPFEDIEWLWLTAQKKLYFVTQNYLLHYRRIICYPVIIASRMLNTGAADDRQQILGLIGSDHPRQSGYDPKNWDMNYDYEIWRHRSNDVDAFSLLYLMDTPKKVGLFKESLEFGHTDMALELLSNIIFPAATIPAAAALKVGNLQVLKVIFDYGYRLPSQFHLTPRNTKTSLINLVLQQSGGAKVLKRATFAADDFCILSQDHLAALEQLVTLGCRFPYIIWKTLYGETLAKWVVAIGYNIYERPASVQCILNYIRYCLRRKNSYGLRIHVDTDVIAPLYSRCELRDNFFLNSRALFSAIVAHSLPSPFKEFIPSAKDK